MYHRRFAPQARRSPHLSDGFSRFISTSLVHHDSIVLLKLSGLYWSALSFFL